MPFKNPSSPGSLESRRRHYRNNKEQYFKRNKKQRKAVLDLVNSLKDKPCADCGGRFHYCAMDFDHREKESKISEVAAMRRHGASIGRILAEIDKCDVVCATCHRIRTHHVTFVYLCQYPAD